MLPLKLCNSHGGTQEAQAACQARDALGLEHVRKQAQSEAVIADLKVCIHALGAVIQHLTDTKIFCGQVILENTNKAVQCLQAAQQQMGATLKEQVGSEMAALQASLHQLRKDNTALQVIFDPRAHAAAAHEEAPVRRVPTFVVATDLQGLPARAGQVQRCCSRPDPARGCPHRLAQRAADCQGPGQGRVQGYRC